MKTVTSICVALCLIMLLAPSAPAHPYASGVTNNAGTISWVLNESATDVQILFNNNTMTNDLGSTAVVGTNTFTLNGYTNFSIVVYKVGSNALNQISSDNNPLNNFYGPRGVTVNKNAKTWNFGRIYVANANGGDASPIRTTTTKGIYAMDAASEDCLNLGNTAATAGISLGSSTTYSPYRLSVGTDDALYVGDAGSSSIGGVWRVDPNLQTSVNLFGLANPSTNTTTFGTNFGRVIGTPNVTGTLAGSNLVLTATEWDLNLANSSGAFFSTATGYQNIYQYNIGKASSLPWTNFPTVITNPMGLGTVNGVKMDVEVAPDGKYFITTTRNTASDGDTNVCVLNSAGTAVLWDSKTQSAQYFGDSVNDHLSIQNYSIAVSPDDKYVVIQGAVNNNFLLMSLTNGVPDISTLTTNTTVGVGGGSTCYAASWDAADNIYVTSGGSDTLQIYSLGLTTTCTTKNDATCTNGSFQMAASSAALAAIQVQPAGEVVQCSSNATFSVGASGMSLSYQWKTSSGAIAGATNSTLTLNDVSVAESGGSYSVIVSNSLNSVTSQVAVLKVVDTIPPTVTLNGGGTIGVPQGSAFIDPGATATDLCAGNLPVTIQGTVNTNVAGTYYVFYIATDPSHNSATNTRTVIVEATNGAPSIPGEPSNQVAQCTSAAMFNVIAGGAAPLQYQWYDGGVALTNGAGISGATGATLTISGTRLSQAGNYSVIVTNSLGSTNSQVATLTVEDLSPPSVSVIGSTVVTVAQGATYTDLGATATDACAGSLPVTTSGSVNVNTPGVYVLAYTAINSGGLSASAERTVTVTATNGPVTASTPNIIPLPVTLQTRPGIFTLCPAQPTPPVRSHALMQILVDSSSIQTGQYLAAELLKSTGYQFNIAASTATNAVKNAILITTSNAISSLAAEGYELTVAPDSVVIRAPAQGGTFYGVQSLLQLLPPQIYSPAVVPGVAWVAPCVYVQDYPRFPWRGFMLDVARHFFNKNEVERVLDAMATQKLNTFHWHLVDDQGWRLQMTNYPNVTTVGAWRAGIDYGLPIRATTATNAAGQYGGYYTQADAREVVAYAQQRHITVVPEIEMPCHSTCALASYPQFGCGNPVGDYDMDYPSINYGVDLYSLGSPGTMAFLEDALTEVMGIFPGKYIHCGGDEVVSSGDTQWNSYTPDITNMEAHGITPNGDTSIVAYQNWLSTTLSSFLQAHGRTMIGWTEFENGGIVPNAALMDWEAAASQAIPTAEAGLPVVMAWDSTCYINYNETTSAVSEPPNAPGICTLSTVYGFNPIPTGLPNQYTNNILGAQCTMFGEEIPSFENVFFKMFPRESAMAEITWTPLAAQNYTSFTNRLVTQEQRFAQMGVNYDHEAVAQIASWGPTVPTGSSSTYYWDITPNVTSAGEIDVNFISTTGALNVTSVALIQNNVQVDIDVHAGLASSSPSYPMYIVHLPETKPGAVYYIEAVVSGNGSSTTSGNVYLPNWN